MQSLVRNRVRDFRQWYTCFSADSVVAAAYGLTLANLWQSADDPNNVFFLLDVEDVDRANRFMARPESEAMGVQAGVIDGEIQYLEVVAVDS